MFGGSFVDLEITNNTLIAHAVNRATGEAKDYLYVFDLETNETVFSLEDIGSFHIVKSLLIVIPLTEPEKKIIFIDLGKFSKYQ